MKKAGIIGGIGPASTLDYYNSVISGCMRKINDGNYPEIVINSVNMTEMMSYVTAGRLDKLAALLVRAVTELFQAGAQFAAIASNTPHIVFGEVSARSPIPLISIVDTTCAYVKHMDLQRVLVIGTLFTMNSGLYSTALEKYGVSAIAPTADEQKEIYSLFFPNLENGLVVPGDKQKMLALINGIIRRENAGTLLLGCTELPLMIRPGDIDTVLIDTTRIHIDAIVDYMTGNKYAG